MNQHPTISAALADLHRADRLADAARVREYRLADAGRRRRPLLGVRRDTPARQAAPASGMRVPEHMRNARFGRRQPTQGATS